MKFIYHYYEKKKTAWSALFYILTTFRYGLSKPVEATVSTVDVSELRDGDDVVGEGNGSVFEEFAVRIPPRV